MSKIKSVQINNFKFFGDHEPIVLDGKNLLLYGENGSGKSSFSNAIYTILEAASKQSDTIKKYFVYPSEKSKESLVNIFAEHGENGETNSFIEIIDNEDKSYRLSYSETKLCGDLSFVESQRASEFINYKSLFSFQVFTHSQDLDLSQVFQYAVIPYLKCLNYHYMGNNITTLSGLFDAYRDVDSLKQNNGKGRMVIYRNKKNGKNYYHDYCKLEETINQNMENLIDAINSQLPRILIALGYNFIPFLHYEYQSHIKHETWIEHKQYRVTLTINEYDGVAVNIHHPHSFLNEAKMSALAFAIRWIIFERRPKINVAPDALRVLVLDDLMISLDMGNREKMMNFLLKEMESFSTEGYQILFMTHERSLFNGFMLKLQQKYAKYEERSLENEWSVLEMYDHEVGDKHFPLIQPYESAYQRALMYFHGNNGYSVDYNSCGNALRQALEEEFKRIFRLIEAKNKDDSKINFSKLMVGDCLELANHNFPLHKFSLETVDKISSHTKFTLNPMSHDSPEVNFYKDELLDAFEALRELQSIMNIKLVSAESELSFDVNCSKGVRHSYKLIVHDDIMANVDAAHSCGELCDAKVSVTISEIGGRSYHRKGVKLSKLYDETIKYLSDKTSDAPIEESACLMEKLKVNNRQFLRDILSLKSLNIKKELNV